MVYAISAGGLFRGWVAAPWSLIATPNQTVASSPCSSFVLSPPDAGVLLQKVIAGRGYISSPPAACLPTGQACLPDRQAGAAVFCLSAGGPPNPPPGGVPPPGNEPAGGNGSGRKKGGDRRGSSPRVLLRMGRQVLKTGDVDRATDLFYDALKGAEEKRQHRVAGAATTILADINRAVGNSREAAELYDEATLHFIRGHRIAVAAERSHEAVIQWTKIQDFHLAASSANMESHLWFSLRRLRPAAEAALVEAVSWSCAGEHSRSVNAANNAFVMYRNLGIALGVARAARLRGKGLIKQADFALAAQLLRMSRDLFEEKRRFSDAADTAALEAVALQKDMRLEEAEQAAAAAVHFNEVCGRKQERAEALLQQALILLELARFGEAERTCTHAVDIFFKLTDYEGVARAAMTRAEALTAMHRPGEAYSMLTDVRGRIPPGPAFAPSRAELRRGLDISTRWMAEMN